MEDYQKVIIIGAGMREFNQSGPPYHFFLEAVIIDQGTIGTSNPRVYQMGGQAIPQSSVSSSIEDFLQTQDKAFVLLGNVTGIDRRAKMIYLSEGHKVSYRYLIVTNGSDRMNPLQKDFLPEVQALADALKLHQALLLNQLPVQSRFDLKRSLEVGSQTVVAPLVPPLATNQVFGSLAKPPRSLSQRDHRVFQVEL